MSMLLCCHVVSNFNEARQLAIFEVFILEIHTKKTFSPIHIYQEFNDDIKYISAI